MCFVMFLVDHHGDGRLAIWCAAPDGVQADLDPSGRPFYGRSGIGQLS